jgi:hypothetical protein
MNLVVIVVTDDLQPIVVTDDLQPVHMESASKLRRQTITRTSEWASMAPPR